MASGCVHKGCIYFWSSVPKNYPSGCKYYVFSQWYPVSFEDPESLCEFSSAEQYMMAGKATLFGDEEIKNEILLCHNPKKAKSLGRAVKNFDDGKWIEARYDIVLNGNRLKFSQNQHLADILLSTGELDIAEAAPNDRIWGIGLNPQQAVRISSQSQWKGLNLLGKVLVQVREELRCLAQAPANVSVAEEVEDPKDAPTTSQVASTSE